MVIESPAALRRRIHKEIQERLLDLVHVKAELRQCIVRLQQNLLVLLTRFLSHEIDDVGNRTVQVGRLLSERGGREKTR